MSAKCSSDGHYLGQGFPEEARPGSRKSFADGSPILQELKEDLLQRGMSEEEAEAYLRQL